MKKVDYHSFSTRLSFLALMIFMALVSPMQAQEEQDESVQAQEVEQESGDSAAIAAGEALFKSNCAACHKMDSKGVGPAMRGAGQKFEREWLYKWIRNSQELIRSGDKQANDLFEEWNGAVMTPFPGLSDEDIDNILAYVDQPKKEVVSPVAEGLAGASTGDSGVSSNVILAVLAVLFLMLVVMLYAVNKTLVRFAKENNVPLHDGDGAKPKAIWKAFAENQFLMIVFAIVLFFGGMYFAYGYLMQIGVDQGYQPVQPIHFSHKIHAGDNQIDCQFCHSSARSSKTSGIPSLNVCMNCHLNIDEYNGEVDIANGYTKEFYDNEIQKLYDAIGWDPEEQAYTGEEKPVKWVRVHNLPDFAYFNHAQHVTAGGLDCQQCHGPVEEMEILTQHSPLTMGWCIECHRTTNVAMEGNEYYEKIHEELSKKYGVERLTVAQMGGLECGKCHY